MKRIARHLIAILILAAACAALWLGADLVIDAAGDVHTLARTSEFG